MKYFLCNVMCCMKIAVTWLCLEFVRYCALQKPTKHAYLHMGDVFFPSELKQSERKWFSADLIFSEFPWIHNSFCSYLSLMLHNSSV